MPERDWQADWELCQQADLRSMKEVLYEIVQKLERTEHSGHWYVLKDETPKCLENARFLYEACSGWPAALEERARLEARVRELEARIKSLEDGLFYQAEVASKLEEENRRLKALAEAAREFLHKCSFDECSPCADPSDWRMCAEACPVEKLREALAALEEANTNA